MGSCEMCGREADLVEAEIEQGRLNVCLNCAKFGQVKKTGAVFERNKSVNFPFSQKPVNRPELEFKVVQDYSFILKSFRERQGLTQEDFAKLINERESMVTKWESGLIKPDLNVANRLEKILGIKLIETDSDILTKEEKPTKSDVLTLGDFIKVRKKVKA
ncbi:MAG: multiprotein bridging factor aMBF1 [Nanoarchaeota archaeon]